MEYLIIAAASLVIVYLLVIIGQQRRQLHTKALPNSITTYDELKKEALHEAKAEIDSLRLDLEKAQRALNIDKLQTTATAYKLSDQQEKVEIQEELNNQLRQTLQAKQERLDSKLEELIKEYEKVTKIDSAAAEQSHLRQLHRRVGQELLEWQQLKLQQARQNVDQIASEIVAQAVQRVSSTVANEHTLTVIELEDDELKGKLIGKNGRNIQWLEKTLGVEVIIDEKPNQIAISGFNSVRREIARRTLELLIEDGRIHPSSIEETYEKAKKDVQGIIMDKGRSTVADLGIRGYPDALIELIGRLHLRTSYGQNMLRHSVEMAHLARLMATEINEQFPHLVTPIDIDICVQGALLHDIGKAMDEETIPKGNHVDLGQKICDRFGLDWRIKMCIASHHNEHYKHEKYGFCVEAPIVDACDNISGSRAGARKETAQEYRQRLEKLEAVAESIEGVTKSWIMRGNKELWVFFDTKVVSPDQMHTLIHQITERIESEITIPAEIKVVGYWEDKIVEYAK